MAKINKHASVLDQLHTLVKKQAEAQSTVVGHPGADTNFKGPEKATETIDKNTVKPEDNKNEFKQEASKEEAGKVVSKSASDKIAQASAELLELLKKQAEGEGEKSVTGVPEGDTKPSGPEKATETIDKNTVKPEDNKNEFKQEASKEEAGKVVSKAAGEASNETSKEEYKKKDEEAKSPEFTKKEEAKEDNEKRTPDGEKIAAKIAAYNLGASLIYDLVKQSSNVKTAEQVALLKEAGRRDFDILISQVAEQLKSAAPVVTNDQEKVADEVYEQAGASYFEELHKNASDALLVEKIEKLSTEIQTLKQEKTAEQLEKEATDKANKQAEWEANFIKRAALETAKILKEELKSESVK